MVKPWSFMTDQHLPELDRGWCRVDGKSTTPLKAIGEVDLEQHLQGPSDRLDQNYLQFS